MFFFFFFASIFFYQEEIKNKKRLYMYVSMQFPIKDEYFIFTNMNILQVHVTNAKSTAVQHQMTSPKFIFQETVNVA